MTVYMLGLPNYIYMYTSVHKYIYICSGMIFITRITLVRNTIATIRCIIYLHVLIGILVMM